MRRTAVALAAALAWTIIVPAAPAVSDDSQCLRPPGARVGTDRRLADELLENRYTLAPHPTVTLPANPTWRENPLHDRNWQFQYHSLWLTYSLLAAWRESGDRRFLDRAAFLFRDWAADNEPGRPGISAWAWNDYSTAWRAVMLACAAESLPRSPWLAETIDVHGRMLAREGFYVRHGNHALGQNMGLLALGCVSGRPEWVRTARERLAPLLAESVDDQGATNEQSVEYELYNYNRWGEARRRLEACGQPPPAGFERLSLMPEFLAHATLPNGEYEMLGDSSQHRAAPIAGTVAEYAATGGARGPKPRDVQALYRGGFAFGRTGWGESRPFADEIYYSLRFGPAPMIHGHHDGGAITLYGFGARLLYDSGKYKYEDDSWRRYFTLRRGHNVLWADGLSPNRNVNTKLIAHDTTPSLDYLALWGRPYEAVSHVRRVVFSRGLGYLLVEDRAASDRVRTYRQFWHLGEDTAPTVEGTTVLTHRARGNLMIRQGLGTPAVRILTGALRPMIQGWRSYNYGDRVATPQVETIVRAREARYLTLLVPSASDVPDAAIARVGQVKDGFTAFVRVGRDVEQVDVRGERATVTRRTDCPPAGGVPATPRLPAPLPVCPLGDWA